MAFTGNIADWSLADILQIVAAERKSGALTLAREGDEVQLDLEHGRIIGAHDRRSEPAAGPRPAGRRPAGAARGGLVAFLVETGRLRSDQARAVATLAGETGANELAAIERAGLLERAALERAFTEYAQDLVHRVLTWQSGEYRFVARPAARAAAGIAVATEGLLLEGMRRIDEAPRIDEIVRPETVFHRREAGALPPELEPGERELLGRVDGRRDARALARAAHLTDYEASEALYHLHDAGLIEARSGEEPPLLDLSLEDLEPTPRRGRLLRILSLALLLAASVAFRVVSHRAALAAPRPADARSAQAAELAGEIFRAAHGREAAGRDELRRAGLLTDAPTWIAPVSEQ